MNNRLPKLRRKMAENEIDAIFVSQLENRYYLSGFAGSSGFLLITEDNAVLATDFRYTEQAGVQVPDYHIFQITSDISKWFPELVSGLGGKRLGFEPRDITFAMYRRISDILKEQKSTLKLAPVEGLVESMRAIKEPEEIELITEAAGISDSAFNYIEGIIQAGMTEKEVAWEMERFLRENGSQSVPFELIVASGPNAALPHARPTGRVIDNGEPVVLDLGARLKGYCSDLSRTICLGDSDDNFRKIYDVVLGAQLTAMSIIREDMTGAEVDSLARTVIAEAGYAEAFGHSLGHGVGLAPHEMPSLGPGSDEKITSGMVFTLEPGIYLSGWGGVRIEDLVLIENGKAKSISQARKV
ncbi:M24 family metallopeptidase [Chloroflexota bacterium]